MDAASATSCIPDPATIMSLTATLPDGPEIARQYKPDGQPDFTKRWTKYPAPPRLPTDEEFFLPSRMKPNAAFLRRHFFYEGRLREHQALWILNEATRLLKEEPNVLSVTSPVTICGDIHGQYYDLIKLMDPSIGGSASKTRYLFLGDYVDRGVFGIECLLLLYTLKINYPQNFLLLRGNHECRRLTDYFTFKLECRRKYSDALYEAAIESFNALPLAAVVENKLFCVHGGLSPHMDTIHDIQMLDRFQEPPTKGLMCDLLWSDPARDHSHDEVDFVENPQRGCSYFYGAKAVRRFLDQNKLTLMIRAHEVEELGYKRFTSNGKAHLMTLFSAPNYLDFYNNLGAVMVYDEGKMSVRQFKHTEHPYWLPNFSDAFTWSLPFVAQKATEMLQTLMSVFPPDESDSELGTPNSSIMDLDDFVIPSPPSRQVEMIPGGRRQQLEKPKARVMQEAKIIREAKIMHKFYQLLREDSEGVSELESSEQHPGCAAELVAGGPILRPGTPFQEVRRLDMKNERLPDVYIEYSRNQSRSASGHTTPQQFSQVLYDEPGSYEEGGYVSHQAYGHQGNGYDGQRRQGTIGTTYGTNPSLRRRTVEEQNEMFRKLSQLHL